MVAEQDLTARLGVVEGRIAEQLVTLQEIKTDLREGLIEVNGRADHLSGRLDYLSGRVDGLSSRIDRMFVSSWAIGGGIIASLIVLIIRGT